MKIDPDSENRHPGVGLWQKGIHGSLTGLLAKERDVAQFARNDFVASMAVTDKLWVKGRTHARKLFEVAIIAAREADSEDSLLVRDMARGIMQGICDLGGDHLLAAHVVIYAAVSAAEGANADLALFTHRVLDGIFEQSACFGISTATLARYMVPVVIETLQSVDSDSIPAIERMLLSVLERTQNDPLCAWRAAC